MAAILLEKPLPRDTMDEEDVRAFCSSESDTEDVYVPGSKIKSVSLVDNVAPTDEGRYLDGQGLDPDRKEECTQFVIFVLPLRH